jgi:thiamine-monophosphate kinase
MLGVVEKEYLTLRSAARCGDIIFVTGNLGGSIRGKHLRFCPRVKEARILAKSCKVGAMIDISDGLAQDLGHILEQSRVGAVIYQDLVPLSRAARNFQEALFMGEDFELLFTARRKEAKKIFPRFRKMFTPIGEICASGYGLRLIDSRNREKIITPRGFRHF